MSVHGYVRVCVRMYGSVRQPERVHVCVCVNASYVRTYGRVRQPEHVRVCVC
jgi:hypothetical protein